MNDSCRWVDDSSPVMPDLAMVVVVIAVVAAEVAFYIRFHQKLCP